MDEINALSAYWHSLSKDSPAKTWWGCEPVHSSVYRALRIDPGELGAVYAAAPFRYRNGGEHLILAAWPAPRIFDPTDDDWLDIAAVIAWDPVANLARVLGDDTPQLVGALSDEANTLFADPRAFFQAWAIRRAQFAIQRQTALAQRWHAIPTERDEVPGALVIGDVAKINWAPSLLPEHLECVGIDPKAVNKAIFKAARLPRVTASSLRSAA